MCKSTPQKFNKDPQSVLYYLALRKWDFFFLKVKECVSNVFNSKVRS